MALLSLPAAAAAIKRLRSSSHSWHLQGGDQYLLRTLLANLSSQCLADSCSPGEIPSRAESLPANNVPKKLLLLLLSIALLGVTYTRYQSFLSKISSFPILSDSSPESAPFPLLSTEIHLPASGANDHGVLAEGKRGRGGCGKDVSEGDGGGESGRHRIQNCLNSNLSTYLCYEM